MKNLAELSQCDELLTHLKDIAAHVLSTDNMRLLLFPCNDEFVLVSQNQFAVIGWMIRWMNRHFFFVPFKLV